VEGSKLRTPLGLIPNPRPELGTEREVQVVARPENLEFSDDGIAAQIENTTFGGGRYLLRVSAAGCGAWVYSSTTYAPGETVRIRLTDGWPIQENRQGGVS